MAALEEIIVTSTLAARPARKPPVESMMAAYDALSQKLSDDPDHLLGALVEVAMELCCAESVGISISENESAEPVFRWKAVAGKFECLLNQTLPRHHSPCGVVLDREQPVLMSFPERYYSYLVNVVPKVEEVLLVPFSIKGTVRGTLWAVSHSADCRFSAGDLETLKRLSAFAAAGYQAHLATVEALKAGEALKKAHAELQLTETRKDEFIAILSHELRTPLMAILGWSQLLQRNNDLPEDARQAASTIQRNARHQAELIEDLIDMNRILSGKLRLSLQSMDLVDTIDTAIESIGPSAKDKRVEFLRETDPEARMINGDKARIQQCIWNLLTNALKFTQPGGNVFVGLHRSGDHIEISVRDSGIGIEPVFLATVFDRFSQADSTATRKQGGLGLGLPIVKSLVELHGGTITALSAGLGQGATFRITIPALIDQSALPRRPLKTETVSPFTDLSNARILVVDDEKDSRDVIAHILRAEGATIDSVGSAVEGLALIKIKDYDLLLSDVAMPEMDGYEFLRQIRQIEAASGKNLTAIALTAHVRSEERAMAMRAGYDMVLAKPIEADELIATAARVTC